jgi:hypothetical protein
MTSPLHAGGTTAPTPTWPPASPPDPGPPPVLLARLDALTAQIDAVQLELIDTRQQVAIAIATLHRTLKELVLQGMVDKKTGAVTLMLPLRTREHALKKEV